MKKSIIRPVAERPDKIDLATYKAAVAKGEIEVNHVTAIEALKNSNGLYELKPEPKPQVEIVGLKDPAEMSNAELVQEMIIHGKRPQKKIARDKAIQFVRDLRVDAESLIGEEVPDNTNDE